MPPRRNPGKSTDPEWKTIMVNVNLWIFLLLAFCLVMWHAVWLPSIHALADYSKNDDPNMAWHLLSEHSVFHAHTMNRTDTNETSPTFGKWTPPPGACASGTS